ncbi:uncharacterized protein LOC119571225 [Penaeus monodon]|uniref:uncharacterized protein LOC119571225 n=1 Tax=Penaeus monodon TaxID=6687 RepID=UPI0018A7233B|nr:uncharacterized protein LOC119571225 [Penaeus monodon]
MLTRLGPAINSGRGMFLFGYPGNGKTSIAERVTKCFGDNIWIPRALGIEGEMYVCSIRITTPKFLLAKARSVADVKYDRRWAYIRRPTIIVGGELTMEQLELRLNTSTNVNEAPVPFDQLVVFSTNLEPKDLVDDAFLRRIPYKIEVENPSEEELLNSSKSCAH